MSLQPQSPYRDTRKNVEINVGKICNNKCVFCLDGMPSPFYRQMMPFEKMKAELRRWGELGHESVGFLGGEPTIYPQIIEAIAYAKEMGFTRIAIATNATRMRRPQFTDKMIAAGLTRVTISMHGHTAELEDRQTRVPGNFEKKLTAIRHLLRRRSEGHFPDGISVNVVLNGWNYKHLLKIQKFFHVEVGIHDLRYNFIRPEGYAEGSADLTPQYKDVVPYVMKAVALNERYYGHVLTFGGFPFCVLPKAFLNDVALVKKYLGDIYRDLSTDCSIVSEGNSRGRVEVDEGRARFNWQERKRYDLKGQVPACGSCSVAHLCDGIWATYLDIHGGEAFEPVGKVAIAEDRSAAPEPQTVPASAAG